MSEQVEKRAASAADRSADARAFAAARGRSDPCAYCSRRNYGESEVARRMPSIVAAVVARPGNAIIVRLRVVTLRVVALPREPSIGVRAVVGRGDRSAIAVSATTIESERLGRR